MAQCIPPPDLPFGTNAADSAAMDGITAQDFLENPELKVYVEDALRLVLAARPEKPLDLIHDYLESVLSQDNVVGREYAYVNATTRNRRAFVRAVHEMFVEPGDGAAAGTEGGGFEQKDVVHLFGLVCPDFPEEIVVRVARILSDGLRFVRSPSGTGASPLPSAKPQVSRAAAAAAAASPTTVGASGDDNSRITPSRADDPGAIPGGPTQEADDVKSLPFVVFLRACNVYFCFQEFFEDIHTLFGSLAFRSDRRTSINSIAGGRGDGGTKATAAREVNLRILLDQLQVMKAEPRNHLRYIDVKSTEAAVRRGGLGDRATLSAFLACLLLHSDDVASALLEKPPMDGYTDRLEVCLGLWSDGSGNREGGRASSPQSTPGDGGADAIVETSGRKKKGARKGSGAGRG
ncbi:unnamed protein product [Ectocarpus sp. 12 AP-2014]